MKSSDEARYNRVIEREEALLEPADPDTGEVFDGDGRVIALVVDPVTDARVDPKTKRPIKLPKDDELVKTEPEDEIWMWLADQLTPALPPDGSLPVPSEATHVFEHTLASCRIRHPENQAFALETLRYYWAGRSEGLSFRFEKPKEKSPKRKRRGGGHPSPNRKRK